MVKIADSGCGHTDIPRSVWRDSLMTAWQSSVLGAGVMRGALTTLPRY